MRLGSVAIRDGTQFINPSVLDEEYKLVFEPQIAPVDPKSRQLTAARLPHRTFINP